MLLLLKIVGDNFRNQKGSNRNHLFFLGGSFIFFSGSDLDVPKAFQSR